MPALRSASSLLLGQLGAVFIQRNGELDVGVSIFANLDRLSEEARGLVPRHDRIFARRNLRKHEVSGSIRSRAPAIGRHYDHSGHVRVQMAVHEDSPGLCEGYRASFVLG